MNREEIINLSFALGHSLHRASQYVDDVFAVAAARVDLTARQLTVMEIISQVDRPSQMEICQHSGIDRSTVADMVQRLMKKGYVERRRNRADARRYALQLTDKGRSVLAEAMPIAKDVEKRVAASFPACSLEQFVEALKGIPQSI